MLAHERDRPGRGNTIEDGQAGKRGAGAPRPPAQAISTRSVAARCQASVNVGRTSARSAGRRKSGQRSHRDSQGTSGGGWPSRYTPKAGLGPSGSGRLRPRPRTSLPEGSRKIPGAEESQNSPTAGWYLSRPGPHIAVGWLEQPTRNRPCSPRRACGLPFVFVRRVRTQAPPSCPPLIPPDGMGQGTEPVEVQAVEGVGRETHHMLLLFALPVMRTRSYRYAKNSVSFFSVVAHCSTPRYLEWPVSRLSTTAWGAGADGANAGRHGEHGPPDAVFDLPFGLNSGEATLSPRLGLTGLAVLRHVAVVDSVERRRGGLQ